MWLEMCELQGDADSVGQDLGAWFIRLDKLLGQP